MGHYDSVGGSVDGAIYKTACDTITLRSAGSAIYKALLEEKGLLITFFSDNAIVTSFPQNGFVKKGRGIL